MRFRRLFAVHRCTAPVRDVQYSPSDAWVAAASEDMELRLIDAKSMDVTMLKKHDGGVRSVCFDPKVSTNFGARFWPASIF
eukprot:48486-Eustigmatos_ZCMA.PRE.1